jgi:hypothetical protein
MKQEISVTWDGEALRPTRSKDADAMLVIGEKYTVSFMDQRSAQSHRFYFADLQNAYDTLPENIAAQFENVEHFRARGLIECGFYNQREFICSSRREADRIVKFLSTGAGYAVFSVTHCAIVERTPKSQSMRAMGKADFEASKRAVLEWAWGMVGLRGKHEVAA